MSLQTALLVLLSLILTACTTPREQTIGPAVTAPQLLPGQVRTADGALLPLRVWPAEETPRAIVLGVHGFNDYLRSFEETGTFLARRGYTLYAYDQRGFGAGAHAGRWFGGQQLVDDLCTVTHLLRQRHPTLPLYVIAESMGGAVTLTAQNGSHPEGSPCPPPIDGQILIAPAVWGRSTMPALQRGVLWLGAHTFPALTLTGRGLKNRPTDNAAAQRKLRDDPLVIKATRVDTIWGLSELMEHALITAPRPGLPTLILYGEHDQIIPKEPFCQWLGGYPRAPEHRLAIYADGWHMLSRDLQGEVVLTDIAAWLAAPKAALPSGAKPPEVRPAICTKQE